MKKIIYINRKNDRQKSKGVDFATNVKRRSAKREYLSWRSAFIFSSTCAVVGTRRDHCTNNGFSAHLAAGLYSAKSGCDAE